MADAAAAQVREEIDPAQARAAAHLMIGVSEDGLTRLTVQRFDDQQCVRLDATCNGEEFAKVTSVQAWERALAEGR
jgi:hypothetical protein